MAAFLYRKGMTMLNKKPSFILFDWGGTLMERMPCWLAREKKWTKEEPVQGARELIEALHKGGYRLGLASNASEGSEESIRENLDTMGIGHLFERIYTWRSVGSPKPWPPFWHYILRDLAMPAEQILMVGDDYMSDVWGAQEAGMYGIWFNAHSDEVRERERVRTVHSLSELMQIVGLAEIVK